MEYTCIVCPNGCSLTVETATGGSGVVITGNKCPRGEAYGRDESTNPRRVVTAVIRTSDPDYPCVPVKTDRAVPKALIPDVLQAIYGKKIDLPVKRGDVCISDCCGTGASIIFTRTFTRRRTEGLT